MLDGSSSLKIFPLMILENVAKLNEKHDGMLTQTSPHSLSLKT